MTRTLTTKRGRSVTTPYSDREAINICQNLSNNFAQDLVFKARKYGLSPDQMTWAHILACEATLPKPAAPAAPTVAVGEMSRISDMFARAKTHLKNPKITLTVNGMAVQLSLAGPRSKNPGMIYVTDGGPFGNNTYYGKIAADGSFQPSGKAGAVLDSLTAFLREFSANPEQVAAAYGKLSGSCCFCRRTLTADNSIDVGYGPICAERFGLSWGSTVRAGFNPARPVAVPEVDEDGNDGETPEIPYSAMGLQAQGFIL
jgi:hypothetical protein